MNPLSPRRPFGLDDPAGIAALAALVRDWEPALDLDRPPRDSLLFEPDGTLYALALRDGMTFSYNRRETLVNAGDLVVVPRGVSVDAGDDPDLVALRHDGLPPDHFRERFIQVWGFEHRPAPARDTVKATSYAVIDECDTKFRVSYAIVDVVEAEEGIITALNDARILVGLAGTLRVDDGFILAGRQAFALGPGESCRLRGEGRAGVLLVRSELAHEARRAEVARGDPRGPSPEYAPDCPRPGLG